MSNSDKSNDNMLAMIVLPGGICIAKELHDELRRQTEDSIPRLPLGVGIKIQDLVATTFWAPLSRGTRILSGRCLAYWVSGGQVALEFIGCRLCNSKRYRRLDPSRVRASIKSPPTEATNDANDDPASTEKP